MKTAQDEKQQSNFEFFFFYILLCINVYFSFLIVTFNFFENSSYHFVLKRDYIFLFLNFACKNENKNKSSITCHSNLNNQFADVSIERGCGHCWIIYYLIHMQISEEQINSQTSKSY